MTNTKQVIGLSLLAGATAVAVPLTWYGAGIEGAQVAARVTARVSAMVFSLALAMRARPASGANLMYGFAVAHATHYAAVTYLAFVAVHHHLHHFNTRSIVVVVFGILLVAVIVLSTDARKPWLRRVNGGAVYLAWLTFVGGAVLNGTGMLGQKHWPALVPLVPLLVAMGCHLRSIAVQRTPASVAANAS